MKKITINIFLNQNNNCELKSKSQLEREKIITKNLASIELENWEEDILKGNGLSIGM